MTDRPTPERALIDFFERVSENPLGTPIYTTATPEELALSLLDKLVGDLGYVIAHPDDHPNRGANGEHRHVGSALWSAGYDDCWNDIFGYSS